MGMAMNHCLTLLCQQSIADSLGVDVHDGEFGLTRMGLTFGAGIKRNRLALENWFCEELLLKAWVTQHRSDFHVGGIIGTQIVAVQQQNRFGSYRNLMVLWQ